MSTSTPTISPVAISNGQLQGPSLRYAVEWRPYLWLGPLKYALGDPSRFAGKQVLELGSRYGKMACWFAAQGARVTGLDIDHKLAKISAAERAKWGIAEDRLTFATYDGNLAALPRHQFDFVFTKSVLVLAGPLLDSLAAIRAALKPGGEYLAVENAAAGFPVTLLRRYIHRRWLYEQTFHGIDRISIRHFQKTFATVRYKRFWGLVYAMRALKSSSPSESTSVLR